MPEWERQDHEKSDGESKDEGERGGDVWFAEGFLMTRNRNIPPHLLGRAGVERARCVHGPLDRGYLIGPMTGSPLALQFFSARARNEGVCEEQNSNQVE